MASKKNPPTGHPHGVYGGAVHVDESRITSQTEADKFRGLRAETVIRYPAEMEPELRAYLENEVLAPIVLDADSSERRAFIDAAAIAMYAKHGQSPKCWQQAEALWLERQKRGAK